MNRTMTCRQAEPWMAILKGVLVYVLLTGQRLTAFSYLADLLLGLAAGGLTGMVRSRAE